jgi:hypothetical protein
MQHLLSSLYFTVVFRYMFREHFAPIIRRVPPTDDYRITALTTTFLSTLYFTLLHFPK